MVLDMVADAAKKNKAYELSNSRDIYAWRVSDHPEVKSALKFFFKTMKAASLIRTAYEKKYKDHIRVIILDLYVAHQTDPTLYITYSRNQSDYRKGSKYSKMFLSFRITKNIIDFLIKNTFIKNVKGYRRPDRPADSKLSRMRATKKLIKLIEGYGVVPDMIEPDPDEEVIILRDENKKDIEYKDTPEIIQMRDNVRFINEKLKQHAILLYITDDELKKLNKRLKKDPKKGPIEFSKKRSRRIFNNRSFEQGGRFYGGWWQNVPREYRHYIMINDKDVVELDFSGLHVNMLYAMKKLPMPKGDVYKLPGYPSNEIFREFLKKLLQAMLNASDEKKAREGIHDSVWRKKELTLPQEVKSTKEKDIFPIMDAFEQKHSKIKDFFCSGKGIDLQYLDSQIAEKVLLHFSKMRYGILPMHDSFIIHHGLEKELEDEMNKAFLEIFGKRCKVDLKYRSIEERSKRKKRKKRSGDEPEVCDKSLEELLEKRKKYSIYHKLE
jgi:hypothetical protein